jgi:hypothetical protein
VNDIDPNVKKALKMATETNVNGTTMVLLPRPSISKVLWMADLRSTALPSKDASSLSALEIMIYIVEPFFLWI